jgi:hypothetical protein
MNEPSKALPAILIGVGGAVMALFMVGIAILGGATSASGTAATLVTLASVETATNACTVTGPVPGLDPTQATLADQIVSAALAASGGSQPAAQIALMVALTESGLHNDGPLPGNDGSLGLFQQRASQGWGTAAQEMDPATATGMFVQHLLNLPGWETMPAWQAAQAVQRSAFADGSNYEKNWADSGVYLAGVLGNGNTDGSCGQGVPGGLAGPPSSFGLPVGYVIPAGTPGPATIALTFAIAQLGKPYVWGAAGPASFDCSGLTQAAWKAAGVTLAHYTGTQQNEGAQVTPSAIQPGDLVLTPGSDSAGPGIAGHVGIYLGNGLVESAIDTAMGIQVQTWTMFISGGLTAVRDPAG